MLSGATHASATVSSARQLPFRAHRDTPGMAKQRLSGNDLHRAMLERALELARYSVSRGSSPIGCVIVDGSGTIISEGRNKSSEPWPKSPQRIGNSGFAHAEMDAFYRVARLEHPEECTVYSSLEPCLMCGGAMGMVGVGRAVWACVSAPAPA